MPDPQSNSGPQRRLTLVVCLLLAALVFLVFGQTVRHQFVNLDDEDYVYQNPEVTGGLTGHGITWAFTHIYASNWHPLTWLSHMLDCQLYGLNPGWHHLTSVLLHAATAILLFLALQRMTAAPWPSAFVAAVFAVHPLRVESVAWISERKDVLSGLFFMLTLAAYVRYARNPFSLGRYLTVALCFGLGLLAKPMLVTLPFVLLLLDYWPLRRMPQTSNGPVPAALRLLLVEKLPLLLLSVASCLVTVRAQREAIATISQVPIALRIGNAIVSCGVYLVQMLLPLRLAPVYPLFADQLPLWKVGLASLFLVAITATAVVWRRKRPYFLVGWLWYAGMLVPVIGLLRVGNQAHADRYTYLPQIGIYLLVAWSAWDTLSPRRWGLPALRATSLIVIGACALCAMVQTSYWRDSITLWSHTLSCTSRNYAAYNNLGGALFEQGQTAPAIDDYQKALDIQPDFLEARYNLAAALNSLGRYTEAVSEYRKAMDIAPNNAEAHNNLATALLQQGDLASAIAQYQEAVRIKPDYAEARYNLANAFVSAGHLEDAIGQYREAVRIKPDYAEAQGNLGNALLQVGSLQEAMAHAQTAAQLAPDNPTMHINFANALARIGRNDDAITQYNAALRLAPDSVVGHFNLGNALLHAGQTQDAIAQYKEALRLQPGFAPAEKKLAQLLGSP